MKRSQFFPPNVLNKYAELKSLRLFNLISIFLFPHFKSQDPPVCSHNFPLPEESPCFVLFFFNSKAMESSESRFGCVKCKYPPMCGEKPMWKAERRGMGCRKKNQVTGRMG